MLQNSFHTRPSAGLALSLLLFSPLAWSQQATPDTEIGDIVTHPVTGEEAAVIQVYPEFVVTENYDRILVNTSVGYVVVPDDPDTTEVDESVTIDSVTTNSDTHLIASVTLSDGTVVQVAEHIDSSDGTGGGSGDPGGSIPFTPPAGDNPFVRVATGDDGDDGDDGWGETICAFGHCEHIGDEPSNGGDGSPGPALFYAVDTGHASAIETVTDDMEGVRVLSIGGDGGQGGDSASLGSSPGRPGDRKSVV